MTTTKPVLFAGGTGIVGREAVAWFRQRHPAVPVLIGGRDPDKAASLAQATGNAGAVRIDTALPRLGLAPSVPLSAVVMMTPDDGLHGLRLAQDMGVPYLSIGNWLADIGAELAHFARRPDACAVVLASHWHGGPAVFLALASAAGMDTIDAIRVGAVIDTLDPTGPAAIADMEKAGDGGAVTLAFAAGQRVWLAGDAARGNVTAIDGRRLDASAFAPYDIVSLQAAMGANAVRFDLAMDVSSSRLRGGAVATELILEIEGERGGVRIVRRSTMEFNRGQAALTGLCLVLAISTALGLEGRPPASPGLYFPELLMDTQWFLNELVQAGATIAVDAR